MQPFRLQRGSVTVSEKNKKSKTGKKAVAIVLAVIILLLSLSAAFVMIKFKQLRRNAPSVAEDSLTYDFDAHETVPETLGDNPEFDAIFEGTADSFKAAIKDWATNGGDIMYSKDVLNILCIGVDTRNKNTISGLTDSMIIVSVNKVLGTITLTSVMRDSYAYLESPDGVGSFNKINSAFPFYGIKNLISTLESHFKIKIDGYAMINFNFFKAVIDKLGGVTVAVQQYEADYINKNYNFNIGVGGAVTLNGEEALAFCRSRNCDSDGDVSRTRRQRQVLVALLQKAATIQTSEITDYITFFLPMFETNYTETELISLATKAVVGGWARFSVTQIVMPDEASRYGHNGSSWFWAVDYPLAAQTLQKAIYGETNITLQKDRVTAIDLLLGKGE